MRRREFITLLGGAAAWPLAARAQERERIRKIGVIMAYGERDPEGQARFSALRQQLQKLGWAEGSNIQIEARWAAGKSDLMQAYARELVELPAEVLVGNSIALLAILRQLTRTIPIVFTQVADPIASGFVSNYARPDGNITGFTGFDASIAGKWMEVLRELAPLVNQATVLVNPEQANYQAFLQAIKSSASALRMQASVARARDAPEIEQAITALAGQTDHGLIILPGAVNHTLRDLIIQLAAKYRLPAVYPLRYYASDGGLLYYGIDQGDQWPKAAGYVDRILRGAKPSDLPVQAATKFELVINLQTAKSLGLEIPPSLLARADEVIE
jgi:putative ABC transport system substrate-binding protein